ncbi:MAG: response regulator transcription factor [Sphingobacterium sp.]|nr:response regulator transcription factor [Sphingobacterium sp.]
MESYRIVVADDHSLFRQGLKGLLRTKPGLEVVGEAGDGLELLRLLKNEASNAHMVILDISMPNLRGLEAIPEIKACCPDMKLLIVTMHADKEYLFQTLAAGGHGYFLKKDADKELFSAIETIRRGKIYVAPRLSGRPGGILGERPDGLRRDRAVEPGEAGPEADRRREVEQGHGPSSVHKRSYGRAPSRQLDEEIEPEKYSRPRQVRHPEGIGLEAEAAPIWSVLTMFDWSHFGIPSAGDYRL